MRWRDKPAAVRPMLATLAEPPLAQAGLLYEPKYDGIRALVHVEGDDVRIWSRLGNEKTSQFPAVVQALRRRGARLKKPLLLDGELVALDDNGRPAGFQRLQGRIHLTSARDVERIERQQPVAFIAFDVLRDGDEDLRGLPLTERRRRLEELWAPRAGAGGSRGSADSVDVLRVSEQAAGDGHALHARALNEGWEGLIAKEARSPYLSGRRSPAWRKLKVVQQQEFVVGGWTEPRQTRQFFGALLLGVREGGALKYVGHTGTGFDAAELERVSKRLEPLAVTRSPFSERLKTNEAAHWVRPELVAQVRFTEWTADGKLRHPVYLGLRDDKKAAEVRREEVSPSPGAAKPQRRAAVSAGPASEAKPLRRATVSVGPASEAKPQRRATVSAGPASEAKPQRRATVSAGPASEAKPQRRAAVSAGPASEAKPASPKGARERSERKARGGGAPRALKEDAKSSRTTETSGSDEVVEQLRAFEDARRDGTVALPDGTRLGVTNLAKIFWPAERLTKGDLLRYYAAVAPLILPAVADRALVMKRFPNGVEGPAFYQQRNVKEKPPPQVRIEALAEEAEPIDEAGVKRFVGGSLITLLYMTQIAAISQDPWFSRVQSPFDADYVAIDLDPGEGTGFDRVIDVARWVHDELESMKVPSVPKTSGSRGLHIYIPLPPGTSYESGMLFCQIVATVVSTRHPTHATVERTVRARRKGTVYVDYLQNIMGKTLATAYSARASAFAGVSTPLKWEEVDRDLDPRAFTIRTASARFRNIGDLWSRLRTSKPANLEAVFRKYSGE